MIKILIIIIMLFWYLVLSIHNVVLLHKIKEFEEENKRLKTNIKTIKRRRKKQTSKKNKYKDRINKAIEYIEECVDSEDIYEQFISTGKQKIY